MKKIKNIFKKMGSPESDIENAQNEEQIPQEEVNTVDEKEQITSDLKAKVDELNDKYLRLYSEFDNFRKRTAKEKIDLMQSAGEDVFKSILPVLDDLERAIKSNSETTDVKAVNDGVNLIFNKLKSTLTQKGLSEMKAIGETFDADIHEAITNIPAPSDELKGKIVEELEKGYSLNGKIIRFAKVIIGN
ncbi:MAG: nucleotide exchange factor GrpE [Bacteroidetes bacterium]|nr:nucleotide exchange factor GrpE [Bacteroidota bacterium]